MKSVYCERFSVMLKEHSRTQREFAGVIRITPDVVCRMKDSEGILFAHLKDIAEHIPDFDFNRLFYGECHDVNADSALVLLKKAEKLLKGGI